ncbi:MAG: phosphoglucosamine mutase, partial [Clostridia bacterium]|nr:phosphoglucosamine mutase [Clostridia bacterium]
TMLEMAIASGLCSFGADVVLAGFIPTPAVAYLVADTAADAGVMISASHNPCEYNGIKLFDRNGYKLPDEIEEEIEAIVLDGAVNIELPVGGDVGNVFNRPDYVNRYVKHVVSTVDVRLDGMKIALDCANGCASTTAEKIFSSLGAQCFMLSNHPNGININDNCGSTHMEQITDFVNANGMDLGLAFDGDSDRCLAVDENGCLIDGDKLIAVLSKEMKKEGRLNKNTAVVTVMTNLGFKHFARDNDIRVAETGVGDRYVLEEMRKNDYSIGGEQSGHIIFRDFATTGDGQLSGVQFAATMAKNQKSASELGSVMHTLPQVMINVTVVSGAKEAMQKDMEIKAVISSAEKRLGNDGRVLVRASGTEPLVRVMLEGKDIHLINRLAEEIAEVVKQRIGK